MTIESAITLIEKAMVQMPPTNMVEQPYLAGYIDALFETGLITDEERGELYLCYADNNKIKFV